jgi:hypothetical protein
MTSDEEGVRKTPSLASEFPELLIEWDYSKNQCDPENLHPGSTQYAWWLCNVCDNSWETRVEKRSRKGTGCPKCAITKRGIARSKPKEGESLKDRFPKVALYWDYEANFPLTPSDVTAKSNKKRHWKCDVGADHKWIVTPSNLTRRGNCPICSGKKIVESNSLQTMYPNSLDYWSQKNDMKLHPSKIGPGSNYKVIWECDVSEDHIWELQIVQFVKTGLICPYCKHKRPSNTWNLEIAFPLLSKEWDYELNHDLLPTMVLPGSRKKVNWRCLKDPKHFWPATIVSRTRIGAGCPYCSGHKVIEENSLFFTHPNVALQWDYERNEDRFFSDGRKITPKSVSSGSSERVWWKCEKGEDHVWITTIASRRNHGCPVCAGQKAVSSNCLGNTRPDLAIQWHYEMNNQLFFSDGRKITPWSVTEGSNKKVWWKCTEGDDHVWPAYIHTRRKSGCPICINQHVVESNCIATTNYNLLAQWDFERNNKLIKRDGNNVTPWTISSGSNITVHWKCEENEEHRWESQVNTRAISGNMCPYCAGTKTNVSNSLSRTHPKIARMWNHEKNSEIRFSNGELITPKNKGAGSHLIVWWKCFEVDDHEWKMEIRGMTKIGSTGCQCCRGRVVVKSNQLQNTHPELAKEWDYSKNINLTPADVTASTTVSIYWKCPKGPDHEWLATLASRVRGNGCPCCSGLKAVKSNSISTTHPELLSSWNYDLNIISPEQVTAGSGKSVWWKCPIGLDHQWQSIVVNRVKGNGCSICANKKIVDSNSFFTTEPELLEEWDWEKNTVTPHQISRGSNKPVWWKCSCSHSWKVPPSSRTNQLHATGCPNCAEYGLRPNDPCVIYLLKYQGPIGRWYKIGISGNLERRIKELKRALVKTKMFFDHEIEVVQSFDVESGRKARAMEKLILNNSEHPEFVHEKFDGSSEFISQYVDIGNEDFEKILL